MRVLKLIETPWTPYAVTFSRDGRHLAIGGGTFFGGGGLILVDLEDGKTVARQTVDLLPSAEGLADQGPTVSGLCFADDGFLAASMWSMRWSDQPSVLFAIDGLELQYIQRFVHPPAPWQRACPTGVLLYVGNIITRHHSVYGGRLVQITSPEYVAKPAGVLSIHPLPAGLSVTTDPERQRFTHHRLIVTRGTVITETGGARGTLVQNEGGQLVEWPVREGLVARSLWDGSDSHIPVHGCSRISAICSLKPDRTFVTGGRNGEVDLWTWEGGWEQERLQDAQFAQRVDWRVPGHLAWVTYTSSSIVVLTGLAHSDGWLSATAGGELTIWSDWHVERVWQLPIPGSPRSLAMHPRQDVAAVGIKQGSLELGVVALVDLG